ncbi:double zinc ribbon domain-containing protein [Persephonella sp. KM09-Lau-8]|uniref:ComF family protein n=1 Tax=Persephonella sp. KM09-Lau-8 TaxID=1158345 RepID=UPI0006917E41|nr:double zinc ribbon domain-containing protein [Persephonella sp. KM09-Lau-8]
MNILNAIFPAKCILCDELFVYKTQNLFCEKCLNQIKKEDLKYCHSCGKKTENCQECFKQRKFDDIQVFRSKDKAITEIIYQLKINGYRNLAPQLAEIIKEDITTYTKTNKIDIITYVPVDKETLKEREFNHLEEILKCTFPKYLIVPLVEKVRKTPLQMELTAEERWKNLKGVFRLKNHDIKDKNILIFDDILTTGATMLNMYKTIKKGRPKKIYGYVIAR